MKRIISFVLFIIAAAALSAQQAPRQTQPAAPAAPQQNTQGGKAAIADGYGNLTWGMPLSDVKDKIEGKLSFTDERKIIISKDGELEYYYGFFYMDPAKNAQQDAQQNPPADPAAAKDEGTLFYVSLKFPYLLMETVKQKLVDKYGESTFEDVIKNKGAIAWDSEKTIIIMWVDQYEKKSYCRRINYISKETTKGLNDYMDAVFNRTELDLIKKLNP